MPRDDIPPPLQPLLFLPAESAAGFSFPAVVDEARAIWFPELEDQVEVRIGTYGALAFVSQHLMGPRRHVIVFHPLLDQPGVPVEVVRFIAKHELTHIVRPPVRYSWGWDQHHAEFWEHERAVGPERHAVWSWIHQNLRRALRDTPRGVGVYSTWRRRIQGIPLAPYMPHLPLEDIPWQRLCPEGGAQLRLPPEWAWRPLLASARSQRVSGALSPFAFPLST